MTDMWLALVEEDPAPSGALALASVREGGWVAAWDDERRAAPGAWRVDPRVVDAEGEETVVALSVAPPDVSLSFDDPAVTGAIRSALSSEPPTLVTALATRDGRYAGALVAPPHLMTPFATIFPQRTLTVGAGLLGRTAPPTGPVTQRYTSDAPWPFDRFPEGW